MLNKSSYRAALLSSLLSAYAFSASGTIISDNFNDGVINSSFWNTMQYGGPTVAEKDGKAYLNMPANSHGVGPGYAPNGNLAAVNQFGAGFVTKYAYSGDFTLTVDYSLLAWPQANGTRFSLFMEKPGQVGGAERVSLSLADTWNPTPGQEVYLLGGNNFTGPNTSTADSIGSLKLVRQGSLLTGYYRNDPSSGWIFMGQAIVDSGATQLGFGVCSTEDLYSWQDVQLACDNFTMEYSGSAIPVPEPSTWVAGLGALGMLLAGAKFRR